MAEYNIVLIGTVRKGNLPPPIKEFYESFCKSKRTPPFATAPYEMSSGEVQQIPIIDLVAECWMVEGIAF